MAKWVFLNNGFIEEEKAVIHFNDLSFQRGYGVFDFFRLNGSTPLFIDDHLERFFFSAKEMFLPVPLSWEEIKATVFELINKNNQPSAGIRLSLTGGCADDGFNIGAPNFLLSQHNFTPPTEKQIQQGISLFSYPFQRQLPQVKTIDYMMAVWLQPKRIESGADDILYHQDGFISESPRSNFFLVTGENKIVTPGNNVLFGITRKKVLQLAKRSFVVEERPVAMSEIRSAREAFLTSTTKQVLPVAKIDDTVFTQRMVSSHLLRQFRTTFL
jgi:branched-subunit amino acid aminotransferase/4-amino-4-deoxychorismate lyase